MDVNRSEPSKVRRRVIQGSLAAPVVMTVSSASAASISSFGRCMANINDQAAGPFFIDASRATDNWLRKEVQVVKLVKGQTSDWFYLDPGSWRFVRVSNPTAPGISFWDLKAQGWDNTGITSKRSALVWVDPSDGSTYRVMQVMRPTGYKATTKSCFTSLLKG